MIPRYTRPEMAQIWAPDNKFRIMLEVETLAAEAMEQTGIIPQGVAKALRERDNLMSNGLTRSNGKLNTMSSPF
jgi:adenylosuccinate lyase